VSSKKLRIFVIESPDPLDLLQRRSESAVIRAVAPLLGHEAVDFVAKSLRELKEVVGYIASLSRSNCAQRTERRTLCIHLSGHGNEDGIGLGSDEPSWAKLFEAMLFMPLSRRWVGGWALNPGRPQQQEMPSRRCSKL